MQEGIFTIRNRLGLHARAAAMFVKAAARFNSNVMVEKDGMQVNGKSIMGLLMLACPLGSKIILKIEGADEDKAFLELGGLIDDGFKEE
ncbi:MAG: HPr family phosphocarrier protein [Syntrophorhabdaceae bacterium]|jgi:phosphocarrier protein|nr:HPr family phosphocarrier protein [Syntrophorhabdaceae bacterium]